MYLYVCLYSGSVVIGVQQERVSICLFMFGFCGYRRSALTCICMSLFIFGFCGYRRSAGACIYMFVYIRVLWLSAFSRSMYLYVCLYSGSVVIGVQQEHVSICLSIFGFSGYRRSAGACIYMFVYIRVLWLSSFIRSMYLYVCQYSGSAVIGVQQEHVSICLSIFGFLWLSAFSINVYLYMFVYVRVLWLSAFSRSVYLYVCLYSGSVVIGVQQEHVSICLSIFRFCGYRRSAGACIYVCLYSGSVVIGVQQERVSICLFIFGFCGYRRSAGACISVCLYSGSVVIGVQQERVSICLFIFRFCGYRRSAGACIYMFVYVRVLWLSAFSRSVYLYVCLCSGSVVIGVQH